MNEAWIQESLASLEKADLKRRLRLAPAGLLNFASNNYFGLSRHPEVVQAAAHAAHQWGAGSTSSRLLSGHWPPHARLEEALAAFSHREAALVFPSGYMANLAVMTTLAQAGDAFILDRLCHASLIDAARLSGARIFVYQHADAEDAERVLKRTGSYRRRFLVTESLFSMDGDFAPLERLYALAKTYDAITIVDDAHAFGVWDLPLAAADVRLGTLSKALGSQGGFVVGSRALIEFLVNRARPFIFTTGLAPTSAAAAFQALVLIGQKTDLAATLIARSQMVRQRLREQGWDLLTSESQIIPLHVGSAERAVALAEALQQEGLWAPAIRPPTVHAGECRLRLSMTLETTDADVDRLLTALERLAAKGMSEVRV